MDKPEPRIGIDLDTKVKIIRAVENNEPRNLIMKTYNLKNPSNISEIMKKKDKYLADYAECQSPFRKSSKKTKFESIDKGLINFISQMNSNGTPVSARILKEKAIELCESEGIKDFKASNGYIRNFKARKAVQLAISQGEANSIDL